MASNSKTPLCELAIFYGTDKCPQINHSYTPYYHMLFGEKRDQVEKVLELGIGHPQNMGQYISNYRVGASLRMWRDYFPNAMIYGADIMAEAMFEDERIKTFRVDETKQPELVALIQCVGSDIDLVIDDASHRRRHQIDTCLWLMPLLQRKVVYVIEDINHPRMILQSLISHYECELVEGSNGRRSDKLIVVRHRK